MGGVHNTRGNSGGMGGYFCGQIMEFPGRRGWGGGTYAKFPPWLGHGYFLEPHNIREFTIKACCL